MSLNDLSADVSRDAWYEIEAGGCPCGWRGLEADRCESVRLYTVLRGTRTRLGVDYVVGLLAPTTPRCTAQKSAKPPKFIDRASGD
jgi:hypothetical protein